MPSTAIKSFPAKLDRDNVMTNPIDSDPSSLMLTATVEVARMDCRGVEAIARSLKAAAEIFAAALHDVPGIKTLNFRTYAREGNRLPFDEREVAVADLVSLSKRKARVATYLGAGATWLPLQHTPVPGCIQRLCAPEPEARCTARDNYHLPRLAAPR
jgi:hypothetical protein